MITINIEDFETYDLASVHEFLLLQEEDAFEVIMCNEKNPARFNNDILQGEFHIAAFVGHLISNMCNQFSYKVPSEKGALSFSFQGTEFDLDKLAELIFILVGFYHTDDEDSFYPFLDDSDKYWDQAWAGEIETPTWGLLRVANKYLK
jgi:hypothetical protein